MKRGKLILAVIFLWGIAITPLMADGTPTPPPDLTPPPTYSPPTPAGSQIPAPSIVPTQTNEPIPTGSPAPSPNPTFYIPDNILNGILSGTPSIRIFTGRGVPVVANPGEATVQHDNAVIVNVQDTAQPDSLNNNPSDCVDVFIWFNFPPAHGTAYVTDSQGQPAVNGFYIVYVPEAGYTGSDEFGYQVVAKSNCTTIYGQDADFIKVDVQ